MGFFCMIGVMIHTRDIERISIGGWFQRTALHLSEIYDFLKYGESPLEFDQSKIKKLREIIDPQNLVLHVGELDHITFDTKDHVQVKIFEDGLIIIYTEHVEGQVNDEVEKLTDFYEEKISPGFSYIFSMGAPVPKELANIKTIYPYFVVFNKRSAEETQSVFTEFEEAVHYTVEKKDFDIYRGDKLYVINNKEAPLELVDNFIEEVIFTREFKGQLHRYLNLHRIIWEQIADVKERGEIKGREIGAFKSKIEHYAKSINLIGARIDQMGSYISTRGKIAHAHLGETEFIDVIGFRYETLKNTLSYVKHIWNMTENYVKSANALFGDLQSAATSKSIKNLTVVTSMGVGASLISLLNTSKPEISQYGLLYLLILAAVGYGVNKIMNWWGMSKSYSLSVDDLNIHE